MATVFVAWPAFLTSSAFGVPRTSSQDVRKPASVNQWLKTGDASQRSYLACPQSVVNGCIKKKRTDILVCPRGLQKILCYAASRSWVSRCTGTLRRSQTMPNQERIFKV